jgi:hypothetical protein
MRKPPRPSISVAGAPVSEAMGEVEIALIVAPSIMTSAPSTTPLPVPSRTRT